MQEKIDFFNKKADIIYKKMIILLTSAGGSGSFAISQNIPWLFLPFMIFSFGIILNYMALNSIKQKFDYFEKEKNYE